MRVECWCALRRNDEMITGGLISKTESPKYGFENTIGRKMGFTSEELEFDEMLGFIFRSSLGRIFK